MTGTCLGTALRTPIGWVIAAVLVGSTLVWGAAAHTPEPTGPATVSPNQTGHRGAELLPRAPDSLTDVHSASAGPYYMQEGADIESLDGFSTAGFTAVYVDLIAEVSPYSTGYELNGLSNTLDWYQAVLDYNWPGCLHGFDTGFEFFNQTGSSVAQFCWPTTNIAAGDLVQLGLNFSGGDVCMSITNIGFAGTDSYCATQPDSGGSYFQLQPVGGFFTGPMTEVVDTTASACLSYESVPQVEYHFVQGAYVSSFQSWADEWNPAGQFSCWSHVSPVTQQSVSNYSETFFNDSGTPYLGPRWSMAENTSSGFSGWWWEYSTDDSPVQLTIGPSNSGSTDVGGLVSLAGSSQIGGGGLIYTYYQDGVPIASTTGAATWTPSFSGDVQLSVVVSYLNGTTIGTSYPTDFSVFSDPLEAPINTSGPVSALDAGVNLTLSAAALGGSGGYSFAWAGLPGGCVESGSIATCYELPSGVYLVEVTVTDSNGFSATSPPEVFYVAPVLEIQLVTNATTIVSGQSVTLWALAIGGSTLVSIRWAGLPKQCDVSGSENPAELRCTLSTLGSTIAWANATDLAGRTASGAVNISVVEPVSSSTESPSGFRQLQEALENPVFAGCIGFVAALLVAFVAWRPRRPAVGQRSQASPTTEVWSTSPRNGVGSNRDKTGNDDPPVTPGPYWLEHPTAKPQCAQCGFLNPPKAAYCARCGVPLSPMA